MFLLYDIFRCLSNCFRNLQIFCIAHISCLIYVFFEIFKKTNSILCFKITYLSIHFSYVGLDVRLDYDNTNAILLFSQKKTLSSFSSLELYSWFFFFFFKEKELQFFFFFFWIVVLLGFINFLYKFLGVFNCMVEIF